MTQGIFTVPGRGHFRADALTAVAVEARTLTDRESGAACEALLIVETKGYAHRVPIATLAEAHALRAEGLQIMEQAEADRLDRAAIRRGAPPPPLPSSRQNMRRTQEAAQ